MPKDIITKSTRLGLGKVIITHMMLILYNKESYKEFATRLDINENQKLSST
jgi:hypothetical protein